jgi:chromosomal replication initiator protein
VDTPTSSRGRRHIFTFARTKPFFFVNILLKKYLERIRLLVADFSQGRINQVSLEVGTKFVRVEESARHTPSPPPPKEAVERPKPALNEGFTLQNFVQGKANQLAYAACQEVIQKPADTGHNPLFLYGATGLGKTHLMQAVGHALLAKKPNARVLYLTSEKFVGGFCFGITTWCD